MYSPVFPPLCPRPQACVPLWRRPGQGVRPCRERGLPKHLQAQQQMHLAHNCESLTPAQFGMLTPSSLGLKCVTHPWSVRRPGPGGKCGHALLPHFWHGGRLAVSIWLSGCLQWTLQLGAKTGSILWNFPSRCSHFNHKHHDAGDGDWWRDAEQRLCGPFQCSQTIRRR